MPVLGIDITRDVTVRRSPRVVQVQGKFDLPAATKTTAKWSASIDLPAKWSVGVIVGPSGAGKSTIGRVLAEKLKGAFVEPGGFNDWPKDEAVIERLTGDTCGEHFGSIEDSTLLLTSVGFANAPDWIKPYHVLSTGQQWRVTLARTLAEAVQERQEASGKGQEGQKARVRVVDEYSSVVDRTVAQIGSAAVAKSVRRYGLQFVAVTCHEDVIPWLEPDWVIRVGADRTVTLELAHAGRWVRPRIDLSVFPCDRSAWALFRAAHYLNHDIHQQAQCVVATWKGTPVAFVAVQHYPARDGLTYREHRLVTLPDFQGVGIGSKVSSLVASAYVAAGHRYYSLSSHPAVIAHRRKHPDWRVSRAGGRASAGTGFTDGHKRQKSSNRLTWAFQYVGQGNDDAREALRIVVK